MGMSCEHFFHPANCLFCRDEEIKRLRAQLQEARSYGERLYNELACVRRDGAEVHGRAGGRVMVNECPHGNYRGFCPICTPVDNGAPLIEPENSELSTARQTIAHMHREREELIGRVKRLRKQFTGASRSVNAERAEKKKVQALVSALQGEIDRLRADLIEERRTATRLLDDHGRACVRAEQAEDRAEKAERDLDTAIAAKERAEAVANRYLLVLDILRKHLEAHPPSSADTIVSQLFGVTDNAAAAKELRNYEGTPNDE